MATRTSVTLNREDIAELRRLREFYGVNSVSETVRRSLAQSSMLKRYVDDEGNLTVERDGKSYVIPSRN